MLRAAQGLEVLTLAGAAKPMSLKEAIREADAVMVRVAGVDRGLIESAPSLKIIAKHGVGYDNIDVPAATRRGIPVTFTPGTNARSVAEFALGLMLAMTKRLCWSHQALRAGRLARKEDYMGGELFGKTLGIVGLGRIGSHLAGLCSNALGMRVLCFDPHVDATVFAGLGVERVTDLADLLPVSDFVSINCPLTAATRDLIGEDELGLMKRSAFLLNTSRGGIVNEEALHKALTQGRIAGAGLDVFLNEPPSRDHPLLRLDNVMATPHLGGITEEAMRGMATMAAQDILLALAGRRPRNVVNPEIYS